VESKANAIEVQGVRKSFRIPIERSHRLKERVVHPLRASQYRELRALDDVSFEVRQGEFFGIVGRNGSGKSTLLKLLASIYSADAGRISVSGRIAPFIELGVGFNPELPARDNVILNGVMMGLSKEEAQRRFDSIISYAELEDFAGLKLKNYSSGMRIRLAFAVMAHVDADVLLIDEVLAVGDERFQRRCERELFRLRDEGKTIVFVTHSMPLLERYCHRAMLLERGAIHALGPATEVANRYIEHNISLVERPESEPRPLEPRDPHARVLDVWLQDDEGRRSELVSGANINLHALIELPPAVAAPLLRIDLRHRNGISLFAPPAGEFPGDPRPGERVRVHAMIRNRLGPGRYFATCALLDHATHELLTSRAVSFTVPGEEGSAGLVVLEHEVAVEAGSPEIALR
jgi:ABC-type polysaccharide/polyol phosphate transport system ATPase subunit